MRLVSVLLLELALVVPSVACTPAAGPPPEGPTAGAAVSPPGPPDDAPAEPGPSPDDPAVSPAEPRPVPGDRVAAPDAGPAGGAALGNGGGGPSPDCNYRVGRTCYRTADEACAAAGCTRDRCLLMESNPGRVSCQK